MIRRNDVRLCRVNGGWVVGKSVRPDDAVLPERDENAAMSLLRLNNGAET